MAASLSKQRGRKHNAEMYSEINDIQVQYGKCLAQTAGVKLGDKVLDMGCGTGELTSFLAMEIAGKDGEVVGVDPDLARINVAIQKHSDVHDNIAFKHGDSSSQFPHCDEQYYDIHFSNFVFQWLNTQEKIQFIHAAFKNLKPGGKIAIQSYEEDADIVKEAANLFHNDTANAKENVPVYPMKKSMTECLLREAGFVILSSEYFNRPYTYPTAEDFLVCFVASDYYDMRRICHTKKKDFFNKFANNDGTVSFYHPSVFQIIAKRPTVCQ